MQLQPITCFLQIIFLSCMFGYLSLLMFHKWTVYTAAAGPEDFKYSERCAPSILITFINMVLWSKNEAEEGCEPYMFAGSAHEFGRARDRYIVSKTSLLSGQEPIQRILLLVAVACVPVLLFGKPIVARKAHNAKAGTRSVPVNGATDQAQQKPEDEAFDFGETLILQGIHTIEFVLGSVSHTASYLRLWALSLAHAQLSEVLWNMVLRIGLQIDGW